MLNIKVLFVKENAGLVEATCVCGCSSTFYHVTELDKVCGCTPKVGLLFKSVKDATVRAFVANNYATDITKDALMSVFEPVKQSHGALLAPKALLDLAYASLVEYYELAYTMGEKYAIATNEIVSEWGLTDLRARVETSVTMDKFLDGILTGDTLEIGGLPEPEIVFTPADAEMFIASDWIDRQDDTLYLSARGVHMIRDVICKTNAGQITISDAIIQLDNKGISVVSFADDNWIVTPKEIGELESYPTTIGE